jgi:mono/diheme cytochrome c family protein
MKPRLSVLGPILLSAMSCAHEFEPPDRGERVDAAADAFQAESFDTIQWADADLRLNEGNAVYAVECRRCHGGLGRGDTDYARERDLVAPSIVEAEWSLDELDALRRVIYIGHESGMPIYGDGDLTLREIDATAAYVLLGLRPDVLGTN